MNTQQETGYLQELEQNIKRKLFFDYSKCIHAQIKKLILINEKKFKSESVKKYFKHATEGEIYYWKSKIKNL